MAAGNQINRLHIRTQLLRGNGTDPSFPFLMLVRRRVVLALGVDFEVQLDHIPQSFHATTEDFLAVGFGADAVGFVTGQEEFQDGVFIVEVPGGVRDNRSNQQLMRQRTGVPEMFLDFALSLLHLRRTGSPRRFPDEFAAGGDTVE